MTEGGQNLTLGTAGDTGLGFVSGRSQDASSQTVVVRENYVTASPPFKDGPLFVYLTYEGGIITGISVAAEPTWANHGPTDITPELRDPEVLDLTIRTGKKFCWAKTIEGVPVKKALKDKRVLAACLKGELPIESTLVEIDLDFKDSDKKEAPHPFYLCAPAYHAGRTYVLLDGQSRAIQRLYDIYTASGDAGVVHDIVKDGYLTIDNQPIADTTLASSLQRCRVDFKLTR
jgi:hypothetical protein